MTQNSNEKNPTPKKPAPTGKNPRTRTSTAGKYQKKASAPVKSPEKSTAPAKAPEAALTQSMAAQAARKPVSRNNAALERRRKRRMRILWILLVLSVLVFITSVIMAVWAVRNSRTSNREFENLSAQIQGYVQEMATVPQTPPDALESLPQETLPGGSPMETIAPTEPAQETEPQILPQYQAVYEQNNDFFGWLKIDGTRMDYPVMHSPDDPEKYLHANFEAKYSYAGTPFLDAACTGNSDNLIIYGHNMSDGSMFAGLMNYQQKNYWEEHPTITFNTLYEEQEYEVVAAFYDRVYYKSETCFKFYQFINAADEADFEYAMQNYREKRLYDTGVEAEYGDQLITLVTCAYHVDNGRFVVVARRK